MEYPEIRTFVKTFDNVLWIKPEVKFTDVIEKCGYPVISKEISETIEYAKKGSAWAMARIRGENNDGSHSEFRQRYMKYAYLVDSPFKCSAKCCGELKKKPVKKFERREHKYPILATMADESQKRTDAYLKHGCNWTQTKRPVSTPMGFWTEQDVLQYIHDYNVPIAACYGDVVKNAKGKWETTGVKRTSCMFCMFGEHLEPQPNKFQRMAITHPKQYDYCIRPKEQGGLGLGDVLDYIHIPYKPVKDDNNEKI